MYQLKFLKSPTSTNLTILLTSDVHNALDKINALGEWLAHKKKEYVFSIHPPHLLYFFLTLPFIFHLDVSFILPSALYLHAPHFNKLNYCFCRVDFIICSGDLANMDPANEHIPELVQTLPPSSLSSFLLSFSSFLSFLHLYPFTITKIMQVSACEGEMSSVISGLENVCGRVVYIPGNVSPPSYPSLPSSSLSFLPSSYSF